MIVYNLIVAIHVIAAICGLGATFALPILMRRIQTVSQARFAMTVYDGVEKLAKIGSITLLLTGIILGGFNTGLFTEFWYIASLVIYVAVQPIVAVILPRKLSEQMKILEDHKSEELPVAYIQIGKQIAPYNTSTQIAAIVLIVLMVLKPF
ncbi:DUF2269 family protein [Peribacillus saganii]|uniref:DUF2269 family protein n=1 Tax=Peribacillus saganii TaxID=2303992 RepID=A0A372LJ31_9BACI|nr:DUF2269 family protein [Peribacillus saganii]RFU66419.1 DUF2269 family protein [Peribacillus saganii]